MLTKKCRTIAVLVGLVGAGAIALADAWTNAMNLSVSKYYSILQSSPVTPSKFEVHRYPVDTQNGTVRLVITFQILSTTCLGSMDLQGANDADANGNIESCEWSTLASSSTVTVSNGVSSVVIDTTVSTSYDAYRIYVHNNDGSDQYEYLSYGKTVDKPF